jgi:hypothetical protein
VTKPNSGSKSAPTMLIVIGAALLAMVALAIVLLRSRL